MLSATAGESLLFPLLPGEYLLSSELLVDGFNLTISAARGSDWPTLDAQGQARLFSVVNGGVLSLIHLRLVDGSADRGGMAMVQASTISALDCVIDGFSVVSPGLRG